MLTPDETALAKVRAMIDDPRESLRNARTGKTGEPVREIVCLAGAPGRHQVPT